MAYADYHDLMDMTEELVSEMVFKICGSYKIPFHPQDPDRDEVEEIDFSRPWKRYNMMETLEDEMKVKFPKDLAS